MKIKLTEKFIYLKKLSIYPNIVTYTTSSADNIIPLVEAELKSIKINETGDELNPSPPKNPVN